MTDPPAAPDLEWLAIERRQAPLLLSFPHSGTAIPADIEARCVSPWLARKDTDWWVDRLYAFARDLDASIVRTSISRTVIDVNRPPTDAALYPGRATTGLVPATTFDGEPLWRQGAAPDAAEIGQRKALYFAPFHDALAGEIERLRALHPVVVLCDCHAIRSVIPRLFPGELPVLSIGTNGGLSCDLDLAEPIAAVACASPYATVVDGRFKGGFITRAYGQPQDGVHAVQIEIAFRGFLREPVGSVSEASWPPPFDARFAAPLEQVLREILGCCLAFAREAAGGSRPPHPAR
ncbi:MAG: N-formylglutamate deformylase [Hyphomicrobiaceae bacterium]|nr:N-formylglutamate deformylase [Hyphomicrobiaceae bacterium]